MGLARRDDFPGLLLAGALVICYASRTGTRKNLDTLRLYGWRLFVVSAARPVPAGFDYALDNGAWTAYRTGTAFDDDAFDELLTRHGAKADFVVLPDIVAGGLSSLELSRRWLNRCLAACPLALLPVQDGMSEDDVMPFVGPSVGIFLGGSTEWKIATMAAWGRFCRRRELHYHVARVNTRRRMYQAIAAGADSIDGSSLSRYSTNADKLDHASRHLDLFAP